MVNRILSVETAEHEFFQQALAKLPDAMELCDQYFGVFDSFCEVIDFNKLGENKDREQAFNNCLRNIEKCFINTSLSILRGDPLNSYASSRKAIESCAFGFLILDDSKAAKAFVEGFAEGGEDAYRDLFNVFKLVQKKYKVALGDYLFDRYNGYCMAVHPSALTSLQHSLFALPQGAPDEKAVTYLFSELFTALTDYLQILDCLCAHLDKYSFLAMKPEFKSKCAEIFAQREKTKAAWADRVKALDPREGD